MALSTPPRGVRPGDFLLVVHDFDARGTDELTLRRGEKIELIELDEGFGDGWYLGKDVRTGTTGLFPGVYTTAAPKIPIRPPREDMIDLDDPKPAAEDQLSSELVASLKSGESTPQASRHASISETQPPEVATDLSSMTPSPNQQHRSSSSPLPTSRLAVDIQQSIRQTLDGQLKGQDSPVMNETLSVIDEHITDLSTPRHSVANHENKANNDSSSEYSSHLEHRVSYIRGHETDEEEENQPTEEQVRSWDAAETARHLRELGVEAKHCDIFEEQEITGDVLLDMDQDFLFMKEFDFGVMGRRLKTWHKVKAFQEEVKGLKQQQQQRGSTSSYPAPSEERSLSRASHTGPFLPRIPHLTRGSAGSMQHPRLVSSGISSTTSSPMTPQTPNFMDHQRRPSAASIREINHHRRHSSIDTGHRVDTSPHTGHFKQSSFDRNWTMASGSQRVPSRSGTYPIYHEGVLPQHTFRRPDTNESDSAVSVTDRYDELERGYFSGPEGDTTKNRRLLQKRTSVTGSATHSRQPSYADDKLKVNKRHSRISSVDSIRDTAKQAPPAAVADVQTTAAPKSRFRSLSTRVIDRRGPTSQSSTTTTSTEKPGSSSGFFSSFAPLAPFVGKSDAEGSGRASSLSFSQSKSGGPKTRRTGGLRIISDVVGKGIDTSVAPASPVRDTDPASVRTGSTTPSTSKSSERHSTESSIKNAEGGISLPRPRASVKAGPKSKKDTSAYMRGLEKKTPQEQMDGCDYSGWMKKRSSNLMTTWKPRLFVLRGRRLSYYYSENDTEERGLIDITAHRVLRADNDPIVALHATITGATASPTSPSLSNGADTSSADKSSTSPSSRNSKLDPEGPFFFKLVPPKTSRTVQFTKPAVHYFQVDSVREGRLWMAALMKATIERDMSLPVETTNKQKTVSLKQARMMNQRPPALMTESELQEAKEEEKRNNGLRIQGLKVDKAPASGENKEDEPASPNSLGGLDTGPSSLLPETLLKSD